MHLKVFARGREPPGGETHHLWQFEDSESFNQLVRTIPLRTKGCVMSNLDRVSGSFLAVIVGGLAILCGGLIVIAIGY